jgi:hypothetical protein
VKAAMTVFKALAILEAAVLECKKRDINTPEVTAALDFLEPHIRPAWLIPQYRHALDRHRDLDYNREGQQQVLRPSFDGIRDSVRGLLGTRLDKTDASVRGELGASVTPLYSSRRLRIV